MIRDAVRLAMSPSRQNVLHWLSWALALSVLLGLTALLHDGRVYGWERAVTRAVQAANPPDWAFSIADNRLTDSYDGALAIGLGASILWFLRRPLEAALAACVFPLHVLGNFPKAIVERERPSALLEGITGLGGSRSFPSGHVEFAVTFYGFLVYLALTNVRGRLQRITLMLAWLAFVVLAGLERIDSGRHWPLDVLVGYTTGIGLLSGLIWLHSSLGGARERPAREAILLDASASGMSARCAAASSSSPRAAKGR